MSSLFESRALERNRLMRILGKNTIASRYNNPTPDTTDTMMNQNLRKCSQKHDINIYLMCFLFLHQFLS